MARRSRKNYRKRTNTRPSPARNITLLIIAIGAFGAFGYLWLNTRCDATSAQIKQLERQKADLTRLVANEQAKWSNLVSYENVMKLLKTHGVQMDWPTEAQIVRVQRSSAGRGQDSSLARN